MKIPNLHGLLIYSSKIDGNEVYVMIDDTILASIKELTKAAVAGGQVFIRLADYLNLKLEADEKLIHSVKGSSDNGMAVWLNHLSVDIDTMGKISRLMPQNYICTSLHVDDKYDEMGNSSHFLCLVYRKGAN